MNRIDRLLALILFLQNRRTSTAEDMAEHFGLSVRTVYRDLAALGEAGVPIAVEAGVGYSLMKGHLQPVSFTAEQARALVMAGMLVDQFADPSVRTAMQAALGKVRAILPAEDEVRTARLQRSMAMTATVPAAPQADLALLERAIAHRRVLRFTYRTAGGSAGGLREVEPQALVHYLERWHLLGWCRMRGAFRDFRTDRMGEVEELKQTFEPREDFSAAELIRHTMPQPMLRARVRFDALSADRARREWWLGIDGEEADAQGTVLTLAAVEWKQLARWLLSFGQKATVLEPTGLRTLLVEAAQAAAAHHAGEPGQ